MSRLGRYDEAIDRGARWIASRQRPDGSHGPDATDVVAYYTCPLALQVAGYPNEALACLDYIQENFVRPDGEVVVPPSMASVLPYFGAWLARESHQWGRIGLSNLLTEHVLAFQDPATGGFFGTRAEAKAGTGRIDFYTSVMAALACAWTGRREEAERVGEYFLTLDRIQPERQRRCYYVLESPGGLVTNPGEDPPELFYLDGRRPLQHYTVPGAYAAALASLHRLRPRPEYLAAAIRWVDFALTSGDWVFETLRSHKLCWGAAELYDVTRERRFRDAALRIADFLVERQEPDGHWHYREEFPEEQPRWMDFDATAQFVCWIAKAREVCRRELD